MNTASASGISCVLMDIDDTITTGGKLPANSYNALWRLRDEGLIVIPVTGRPAGWCDLIAREWPVSAVIGENGALVYREKRTEKGNSTLIQEYHPNAIRNTHPVLQELSQRVLSEVPGIRLSKDQNGRLFDIAFDFAEDDPVLPLSTAQKSQSNS